MSERVSSWLRGLGLGEYRRCVVYALLQLDRAGVIERHERGRLFFQALRAWREARRPS